MSTWECAFACKGEAWHAREAASLDAVRGLVREAVCGPSFPVRVPVQVGSEESLLEIEDRYMDFNKHADSYTWKVRPGTSRGACCLCVCLSPTGCADVDVSGCCLCVCVQALGGGELFKPLDMSKTLEENGVADEVDELTRLGLDPSEFIPVVQIYFKDDLTVA